MIYGLAAALAWGFADYLGAVASRRLGSFVAVVVGQVASAVCVTVVFVVADHPLSVLAGLMGVLVANGIASMSSYPSARILQRFIDQASTH